MKRKTVSDAQEELRAIVTELFGLLFEQVRRDLFGRLTRYVAMRMTTGHLHSADPPTAARFIIETVTFFARHRVLDPHPQDLDDDAVRQTIVDLVTRSLAPATRLAARTQRPARSRQRRK